jgi:hypothetical protein
MRISAGGCDDLRHSDDLDDEVEVECCNACHVNEAAGVIYSADGHDMEWVDIRSSEAYELCCTMAKALRFNLESV